MTTQDTLDLQKMLKKMMEYLDCLDEDKARLEAELAAIKADRDRVVKEQIPELFLEMGIAAVEMENGEVIAVEDFMAANIRKDQKSVAIKWLIDHGHGDIVRNSLSTVFVKGDNERAARARMVLEQMGLSVKLDRTVHPQTFKKFAKDLVEEGEALPDNLFNIHTWREAVVKR